MSAAKKLIEISAEIVRQKLRARISAAAYKEDTDFKQQSLSVIAGMFTEDGRNRLVSSLSEFLDCKDGFLFVKFQSIVVNNARQELFHRWDETNPLKAKIWRNVSRVFNNDERFTVFHNDHPEYVCLSGCDELSSELPLLNADEIAGIAADIGHNHISFSDFLMNLLIEIRKLNHCSHVIRKDDLIAALYLHKSMMADEEMKKWSSGHSPDPELELIRSEIMSAVMPKIECKLDEYARKSKLTEEIAAFFCLALTDLLADYTQGGPAQSNYCYLKTHWEWLAYDAYRRLYRSKFEYLAEYVRDEFILFMKNNYEKFSAVIKKCRY
ncbi:MAG: hypothetical protein AB1746_06160 [Candidatus Zixiibacteriota bacterium]